MKLVHWPLMGGLLHLVQRGGDWRWPQPAQSPPRCTKCNSPPVNGQCTNHRIAVYNGPLLCAFNVAIEGLTTATRYITSVAYLWTPRLSPRRSFSGGGSQRTKYMDILGGS